MSESTVDLLAAPAGDLVFVDEVTVRGRSASTRLWGLADRPNGRHASGDARGKA
jgi:hypothetical protein